MWGCRSSTGGSHSRAFFYTSADAIVRYEIATHRYTATTLPRMTYGVAANGADRYLRLGTCIPGCPAIPPPAGSHIVGPMPLDLTRTDRLRFAGVRPPR